MQKIIPHLWFDKEAKEAAEFYVSVFGRDSKIGSITTLHNTPSGDANIVPFEILGYKFMSISAGPLFKFNSSISFLIVGNTKQEIDGYWAKLSAGGRAIMELGEYPFSKLYGWIQDKYGLSWQVTLDDGHYPYKHKVTPTLMFTNEVCGKAEEAIKFYASIFPDSKVGDIARYPEGANPDQAGTVMHGAVVIAGQEFFAMDSAQKHKFKFNEAISLMVNCRDQKEIDYYWEKLTADGGEESMCGWLKDKYGVSWQIVPITMNEMMAKGTPEQISKVTEAFLSMKKFDLVTLEKAYKVGS